MNFPLMPNKNSTSRNSSLLSFAKTDRKIDSHTLHQICFFLSALIPFLIHIIVFHLEGIIPFGNKTLFLGDNAHISFTVLYDYITSIRDNSFSLMHAAGLSGINFAEAIPIYLGSPFHLLLPIFSVDTAFGVLSIITAFRIGLAGMFMYIYLCYSPLLEDRKITSAPRLILAISYALSSSLVVAQSGYMYVDSIMLLPLLILSFEKLIFLKKKRSYVLILTIMLIDNCLLSGVLLALLPVYYFFILVPRSNRKPNLSTSFWGTSLLALFLSSFMVVPGFSSIFKHFTKADSWPDPSIYLNWNTFFSRFLSTFDVSSRLMDASGINLSVSAFVILLLILCTFSKKHHSLKSMTYSLLFFGMLCIFLNTSTGVYSTNYFSVPQWQYNPLCSFMVFFLISAAAFSCSELNTFVPQKSIFAPVIIVLYLYCIKNADGILNTSITLTCIIFLIVYIFFTLYRFRILSNDLFMILCFLFTVIELSITTEQSLYRLSHGAYPLNVQTSLSEYELNKTLANPFFEYGLEFDMTENIDPFILPSPALLENNYTPSEQEAFEYETINSIATSLGASSDILIPTDAKISITGPENLSITNGGNNIFMISADAYPNATYPLTIHIKSTEPGEHMLYINQLMYAGFAQTGEDLYVTIYLPKHGKNVDNILVSCLLFNDEAYTDLKDNLALRKIQEKSTSLFNISYDIPANQSGKSIITDIPYSNDLSASSAGANAPRIVKGNCNYAALCLSPNASNVIIKIRPITNLIGILLSLIAVCFIAIIKLPLQVISHSLARIIIPFKRLSSSVYSFLKKNRMPIACVLLPFSILLIACIAAGFEPFGSNVFFKTDGSALTMPLLYQMRDTLREGELFYSRIQGGGSNLFYSSPGLFINFYMALFGQRNLIPSMTILILIKTALSGYSMYHYLTHRIRGARFYRNDPRILILSCSYSLSAYTINFRQFLGWPEAVFLLPLLIEAMDQLMLRKKHASYTLILALSMILCTMHAIYFSIFLCIWFFSYRMSDIKDIVVKGVRFAASSILAAGMSFWILGVNVLSRSVGAYGNEDSRIPNLFIFYKNYLSMLRQFFLFPKAFSVSENCGDVNLYFGTIMIVPLLIGLYYRKRDRRSVVRIIAIVIMILSCNNELLAYIWNGLHYQVSVPNRYSFILIFLLIDIAGDGLIALNHIRKGSYRILALTAILVTCVAFIPYDEDFTPQSFILSCGLIILSLAIIKLRCNRNHTMRYVAFNLLCLCVLAELSLHCCHVLYYEDRTDGLTIEDNIAATDLLKRLWLGDDKLTRVNYLYLGALNQNLINNVSSMSQFNSYVTEDQKKMFQSLGIYASSNNMFTLTNETPFTNAITNTGYMILSEQTTTNASDLSHYQLIGHDKTKIFLKNDCCLPAGLFIPKSTIEQMNKTKSVTKFANLLASSYNNSRPVYADIIELEDLTKKQMDASFFNDETTNCFIYDRLEGDKLSKIGLKVTPSADGTYYFRGRDFYYLGHLYAGETYTFRLSVLTTPQGDLVRFDEDAFHEFYQNAHPHCLNITSYTNSSQSGTIACPDDGYILLSLPYEAGWTVKIDGKPVIPERAPNNALMLNCKKGMHKIEMLFRPKGLGVLAGTTIAFWLLYIISIILSKHPLSQCHRKAKNFQ